MGSKEADHAACGQGSQGAEGYLAILLEKTFVQSIITVLHVL